MNRMTLHVINLPEDARFYTRTLLGGEYEKSVIVPLPSSVACAGVR